MTFSLRISQSQVADQSNPQLQITANSKEKCRKITPVYSWHKGGYIFRHVLGTYSDFSSATITCQHVSDSNQFNDSWNKLGHVHSPY